MMLPRTRLAGIRSRWNSARHQRLSRLELEFQPEVLELAYRDAHNGARWVLRVIVTFCGAALLWSCLTHIDVIATAPGKVIPLGELKLVQAVDGGRVVRLAVQEGQTVREGDLLIELDEASSQADMHSTAERLALLRAERVRVQTELSGGTLKFDATQVPVSLQLVQQSMLQSRTAAFAARLAELNNALHARELNRAAAEDTLHKLQSSLLISREKEARVRSYVGTVVTRFDYLKLKDELGQLENEVAYQTNMLKAAHRDVAVSDQQLQLARNDHRSGLLNELSECDARIAALAGEVQKAGAQLGNRRLYAPVAGTVQRIVVNSSGQVVTAGQTLLSIVPHGTPTVVEAFLSNEDAGFVHVGQEVMIKVDAYPFERYGMLRGKVLDVGTDAVEKGLSNAEVLAQGKDAPDLPTKAGLAFKLRIQLVDNALGTHQTLYRIRAGMTVQADIKTDRRRVIDFLVEPISGYTSNGLSSR